MKHLKLKLKLKPLQNMEQALATASLTLETEVKQRFKLKPQGLKLKNDIIWSRKHSRPGPPDWARKPSCHFPFFSSYAQIKINVDLSSTRKRTVRNIDFVGRFFVFYFICTEQCTRVFYFIFFVLTSNKKSGVQAMGAKLSRKRGMKVNRPT